MAQTISSSTPSSEKLIIKEIESLFKENTIAKIIKAAEDQLRSNNPPLRFPETVPQKGPDTGVYQSRDAEFWTCGFFPGAIYCILERMRRYTLSSWARISNAPSNSAEFPSQLNSHVTDLCISWSGPLHAMSSRHDTHDLGFIVQPALRRDWELFGNHKSLDSLLNAAHSLASRFDERVGAIRSWDSFSNAHHNISSLDDDFIVIIDSLCNLDLLFYAASYIRSEQLFSIARTHATTLISTHLRRESIPDKGICYSTYHGVNFSRQGHAQVKRKLTAQGYSDESTWARGQAWAILGYAQTYGWTKDRIYLDTAKGLADYFIFRLESAPDVVDEDGNGRFVPLWDFDAPITYIMSNGVKGPLRDVSAGMVAANGLLILHGQLLSVGDHDAAMRYLKYALAITKDTINLAYDKDEYCLQWNKKTGHVDVESIEGCAEGRFDGILRRSTANFNEDHADRHWDHGLVYADYYFLELGNRLLEMGLV